VGHDLFHPYSSHVFILPFDASSSEQIKNREKWRLIIQEAKAHPELYRRGEGRKESEINGTNLPTYLPTHLPTRLPTYLSLYGYTALMDLGRFFIFLILYTFGRTLWKGDQPIARPLPTHETTQTQNKRKQASMSQVGFVPTIPVFERIKTVHARPL
jgi:hypothetical protein